MEKEFVPYELALRMKQLGFNEYCLTSYLNGELQTSQSEMFWFQHNYRSHPAQEFISAPTFQQAFRWFREKYSMYHQIHKGYGWEGIVRESNNNESILWHDGTYNSPEEAELACLKKLIEIVEQKQKEL